MVLLAACGAARTADRSNECPPGDVVVQVDGEAAALDGCRGVKGRIEVGPSFALRSLAGLARIERARAIDVSDNVELTGLFLPALVAVEGDLVIDNNRQVATVSLHHLVEVKGDLVVADNRALVRLDLGALRRVGGRIAIRGHPQLDTVVLDRLESAGELLLEDNPAWPEDEVESVRRRVAAPRSRADRGHESTRPVRRDERGRDRDGPGDSG
jgi:hypothetical protein